MTGGFRWSRASEAGADVSFLAEMLVGRPLAILAVALLWLAAYGVLRSRSSVRPRPLLIASAGWGLYAAWEWLVLLRSPEADIRVDLLVIWPALALLSAWALFRALRWRSFIV
jgi:hypothetical protein